LSSKLLVLLNYCFDTEILNRTIPSLVAQMIPNRVKLARFTRHLTKTRLKNATRKQRKKLGNLFDEDLAIEDLSTLNRNGR